IREELTQWIKEKFLNLKIDQSIVTHDHYYNSSCIESIKVVDVSGEPSPHGIFQLKDVILDVQAYRMHQNDQSEPLVADEPEDGNSQSTSVQILPHRSCMETWDSLVFEDLVHKQMLRYLTRMISLTKNPKMNLSAINWNRIVLFHGAPGCGKSSLCRALAHKLTIRLGKLFAQGKLIEVHSQCLISKWFGESGRLVAKLFEQIEEVAREDESTLVCVLIDEVESIAGRRERSVAGNEAVDSLRATNQLLTALDRLKTRTNILIMCTSNIVSALDRAFLDRVDDIQHIKSPSKNVAYEIFRSCLTELVRCGIFTPDASSTTASPTSLSSDQSEWELVQGMSLARLEEVRMEIWNQPVPPAYAHPSKRLWEIAQKCEGWSGRTLRRLPIRALAKYTYGDCSIDDALDAMAMLVDERMEESDMGTVADAPAMENSG
ncbi:AAA-domain-containing protein, partial [Eremomyces bilateralis CBS 781.70]